MKLRIELDDGKAFEAVGSDKTWMCLADRVAFEKRFGQSVAAFQDLAGEFDEDGKPVEGADLSSIREEWMLFFAWRELRRRDASVPDYDEVVDRVVEIDLDVAEDGETDPT